MVLLQSITTKDQITGNDFGTRKNTVTLVQPIQLDPNKKTKYQIQRVILTPEIPNVYSYGSFDNTKLRISNDGGLNWTIVQFANGIYQIDMIQANIFNAMLQAGWVLSTSSPPVIVNYNPATRLVYVTLDSTLLKVGTQVGVDFGYSKFYQMLGFSSPIAASFVLDGTFSATLPPQLDVQGTYVNITCTIIQGSRYINGKFSNIIATVPITTTGSQIEIVWPSGSTGFMSPEIECTIGNNIISFEVDYLNANGDSLVVLYGNAILEIVISNV